MTGSEDEKVRYHLQAFADDRRCKVRIFTEGTETHNEETPYLVVYASTLTNIAHHFRIVGLDNAVELMFLLDVLGVRWGDAAGVYDTEADSEQARVIQ